MKWWPHYKRRQSKQDRDAANALMREMANVAFNYVFANLADIIRRRPTSEKLAVEIHGSETPAAIEAVERAMRRVRREHNFRIFKDRGTHRWFEASHKTPRESSDVFTNAIKHGQGQFETAKDVQPFVANPVAEEASKIILAVKKKREKRRNEL